MSAKQSKDTSSKPLQEGRNYTLGDETQGLREINFSTNQTGIRLVIPVQVQTVKTQAVIDTAAQVSVISEELAKQY